MPPFPLRRIALPTGIELDVAIAGTDKAAYLDEWSQPMTAMLN